MLRFVLVWILVFVVGCGAAPRVDEPACLEHATFIDRIEGDVVVVVSRAGTRVVGRDDVVEDLVCRERVRAYVARLRARAGPTRFSGPLRL